MTADGGMNPEPYWDEARIALGRVGQLLSTNVNYTQQDLYNLENYELIPQPVRQTIEGLTPRERETVRKIFTVLSNNHFYLENSNGGVTEAY
jgi:hypothetical protein